MPSLPLSGCAPIPLAHYLKALGVLRLVSEQKDSSATGRWSRDQFILDSALDREGLLKFFLEEYQPTPVMAPWNGGSGFHPKDNSKAIESVGQSTVTRLAGYAAAITAAQATLRSMDLGEKPTPDQKVELLLLCRNVLPESALQWLDAAYVLTDDGAKYPPLLGTGGNDGRLEFTNNFMQRITEIMDCATGQPVSKSEGWLNAAFFGSAAPGSTSNVPIGQFFPGAAGGANSTSGFGADSAVNPWDFVLMLEGALLFAAASVKRLESLTTGALVYPFCVRQSGVGYASASMTDEKDSRCEMWMPLWDRSVTLNELAAIFSEGRAQVGGRTAKNGIDFARAVVTFGVDRGISAFQRFGFQVRNGLAYFATPLDRVIVKRNVHADLLTDLDVWHGRFRAKIEDASGSIQRALNLIERQVIDFCQAESSDARLAILIAAGQAERALARNSVWALDSSIPPLGSLRSGWLVESSRPEFRLAKSLTGMCAWLGRGEGKGTFWFRSQLEPVEIRSSEERCWLSWLKTPSNDVTWHDGDLTDCFNAILSRRIQRIEKAGVEGWPDWSPHYARLEDITAFIERRTDDALLTDLIWGLSLIDWQSVVHAKRQTQASEDDADVGIYNWGDEDEFRHRAVPSSFYAIMKLCYRRKGKDGSYIPVVPAIHQRAQTGDGKAASRLAARRLRASGETPLVSELPVLAEVARRTAAALIFPISPSDTKLLKLTIERQPDKQTA